jgi:hypothetical protein
MSSVQKPSVPDSGIYCSNCEPVARISARLAVSDNPDCISNKGRLASAGCFFAAATARCRRQTWKKEVNAAERRTKLVISPQECYSARTKDLRKYSETDKLLKPGLSHGWTVGSGRRYKQW